MTDYILIDNKEKEIIYLEGMLKAYQLSSRRLNKELCSLEDHETYYFDACQTDEYLDKKIKELKNKLKKT